ncbi:MAG: glycoside hydrolase family 32 protein [Clostridia bacterium]|nr:glycoside hydrolase family 32 protein [Clostridia bacterium]
MKKEEKSVAVRPNFHITGEQGWINDPNGLVVFQGRYHAFFQYYPHDVHWGPMHWGHVVSDDLVHWERLPIALYPGGKGEENGCFSGSAIVWQDKLYLLYTGFTENGGGEEIRQLQCLASSDDGIHFVKHGVVIGEEDLPEGYCPWDFRDPKIWRKEDTFYCVVAAKAREGRGRIILFKSQDLFKWEFVGDLLGTDSPGIMIECPDYCDEKELLFYCEQFQPNEGNLHLNVHTNRFCLGKLEYESGKMQVEKSGIIDYGFDFYAPQSFAGADVMIGWLNMWDRNVPAEKYGFAGMLTVPRRFSVRDGELHQTPVISGEQVVKTQVSGGLQDNATSGVLRIEATGLKNLTLRLRKKGDEYTQLSLQEGQWVFDRSKSGEEIVGAEKDADSLAGIRRMPKSTEEKTLLTVVMDTFSVEIFEGGKALSATVYPDLDADGIELSVEADDCVYVREEIK